MELSSFKELLLKKSKDNVDLYDTISSIRDDIFADIVTESLEKMAAPGGNMGGNATSALTTWASNLTTAQVAHLHDALSHHISHYKAALKNNDRELADKHAKQIIPIMHLAAQAARHSDGKLAIDYEPLTPWERNYTSHLNRKEARDLGLSKKQIADGADARLPHEGTKNLGRRLSSTSRSQNAFSVPDYQYLEMKPSPFGTQPKAQGAGGGYPFENIRVGSSNDVNQGKGYVDIHDVGPQDKFAPHPFDHHPVFSLTEKKAQQKHISGQEDAVSDAIKKWSNDNNPECLERIKKGYERNPQRGVVKSESLFKDTPLQKRPLHHPSLANHYEEHGDIQSPTQPSSIGESKQSPTPKPAGEIDWSKVPSSLRDKLMPKSTQQPVQHPASQPVPESKPEAINPLANALADRLKNRG